MDPSGAGGIGKAAGELVKEMQRAEQELQQPAKASQGSGANRAGFEGVMRAQQQQAAHGPQGVDQAQAVTDASKILLQAKVEVESATPSPRTARAAAPERSRMIEMLESLIGGQDKMAGIMNMALSGRRFSPSELIAMQAGVYRFSQELELTSKVIEKGTSGIKQTMNTQV